MKIQFVLISLVLLLSSMVNGQIEITLDNDTPQFTSSGQWFLKTTATAVGGDARYKKKGDGSSFARWQTQLTWPGAYHVEMHIINGNYADSVFCTVHTAEKDTTILVNQYYSDRWQLLGTFNLPETSWAQVTDKFRGKGLYVLADAIKLTFVDSVYSIGGQLSFSDGNDQITAKIELFAAGAENPALSQLIPSGNRNFTFENIPNGNYKLVCSAYGYDASTFEPVVISGADISGLNLTLNPSGGARYQISGVLAFNDANPLAQCQIEVYPLNETLPVCIGSVGHNETYVISNLLSGHYRFVFSANGYLRDSTTFANVEISNANVMLDTLTMYRFFKFAWISDSHIGAGTDAALQQIIDRINLMKDDLDFLLNTGDLTEKGLNSELTLYKSYIDKSKIPVYNIPGNHDTKWSQSGFQEYRNIFGSSHFSFTHNGFKMIGINDAIIMRGGSGFFDPTEIAWLENELQNLESPNMPVLVAYHLPSDIGGVPNYWQGLDLLKRYRVIFVMVGHGHSNRAYDFEGVPGAMSRDTYGDPPSFNIVTTSEKEIEVRTCNAASGQIAAAWYKKPTLQQIQPSITFSDLEEKENISGSKTIQLVVSATVTDGQWEVSNSGLGKQSLSGSGENWSANLETAALQNGFHTIAVSFNYQGKTLTATRTFYVENNYPKALWKYQSNASVITQPAFDQSGVYAGSSDGRIIGLNYSDGMERWLAIQTGGGVHSSPVAHENTVYAGSSDGKLYAINAASGSVLWTFSAEGAILTAPVINDTLIYFAGGNSFYAVGLKGHKQVWKYSSAGVIECKPAISGDKIIFGSWDRSLYALDLLSGVKKWSWNRTSSFYYAPAACWPVATSNRVFITDPERYMTAIDITNGAAIWSGKSPEFWESVGISADKTRVYGRSLDGNLYAYSTTQATQTQLWKASADFGWDSTPSMPAEYDGIVFSGGKKGFVVSINGQNGQILWKYWVGAAQVTSVAPVDRSHVLVAALDGAIMLIEGDPTLNIDLGNAGGNLPENAQLFAPYPNPFNNSVTIAYSLPKRENLRFSIYNILGEEVFAATAAQPAGTHKLTWNGRNRLGSDAPSGVYFVNLKGESLDKTMKVMLVK